MKVNVSGKYDQKLHDHTKKSARHAIKTASKKAVQKSVEATDNLTGNKIANKITKDLKSSPQQKFNTSEIVESEVEVHKEIMVMLIYLLKEI